MCIRDRHYADVSLIRNEKKTTLVPGSLPTLNLPTKSFEKEKQERSTASIQKRDSASTNILPSTPPNTNLVVYKTFEDFKKRIVTLKLALGWEICFESEKVTIKFIDKNFLVPKYQIVVQSSLTFCLLVFNWKVDASNEILKQFDSSFKNVTLSNLIHAINNNNLCGGLNFTPAKGLTHTVPKLFDPFSDINSCLLYTSPSPRDATLSRMPSSA